MIGWVSVFLFWRRWFFFAPPVPSKPIITRAAVNSVELEQLIEEFSLFKSDTASELMRRNYVRHQQEQRRKMLAKLEDNSLHTESQVRFLYKTHWKLFHYGDKWRKMVNFKLGKWNVKDEIFSMSRAWDKDKIWVSDGNWTHDLPNNGRVLYPLSDNNSWWARPFY